MLQDIRIRQRDYLLELARILSQELDLDTLLWQILRISINLMGGEAGLVALIAPDEKWKLRASMGLNEPATALIESYLRRFSDVKTEITPEIVQDVNTLIERLCNLPELSFESGVGLPLMEHGVLFGIIIIFRNYHSSFSLNESQLFKVFADQAAIAVHNAYLYGENRREKNRLNALIDAVTDGIIVLNLAHRIERVNPAVLKMLKTSSREILGHHHDEIIQFSHIETGMVLSEAEAGGWPFTKTAHLMVEGDLNFGPLHEKPLPVDITYAPVMNQENSLQNIIAVIRDISKFREADDLKNTFISTISHELKTPVALIKGYASTLRIDDGNWNKDVMMDALSVIEEEADRLTSLINNLLDASRLYSGALMLNRSDVNIARLAQRVAERMQTQTKKHTIRCLFPPDLPIIYGDADRIEQVITNLISNALKYSSSGEILIAGGRVGAFIQIAVMDEGNGLQAEDIPHLFERFYRASKTANSAKGVGLGLFLANAVIEGHGGKMWAENRTDRRGASFYFTLPLDPDDHPATLKFRPMRQ